MTRLLQIAHLALLLSAGALCVCACFLLLKVEATVQTFQQDGVKLAQTIDLVNRPCGGGKPCGTLAEIGKDAAKAGDAIVTTQIQERAITPSTVKAMGNLSEAANSLTGTANAATGTLNELTSTTSKARQVLSGYSDVPAGIRADTSALQATLRSANKLISDPQIPSLIANVNGTVAHLDAITGDAQTAYHRWLYPPPCTTRRCKWGRFLSYLPDVTRGIQAADAAKSLFSGTHIYGTVTVQH